MRILDRYIAGEVVRGTLLALLVLLALLTFFTLVAELEETGKGNYGVWQAIEYVLLTLPRRTYELLPTATLLGSMLGLGALAANSELVVIRAAGVSFARIIWAVLKVGIGVAAVAIVLGEFIGPASMERAQNERAMAMSGQTVLKSGSGLWARDGRNFINVQRLHYGGRIEGIWIYEFDERHRLRAVTQADAGLYAEGRWLLQGLKQSVINEDSVSVRNVPQDAWTSLLKPELLNLVVVKPEGLSAFDLYKYVGYLRENGLNSDRYQVAFWSKIVSPLANLVMLLVALPFVFGPLRSVAVGQRMLAGVLVGVSFYLLNQTFGRLGQIYDLSPFLSAALPTLAFLAAALVAIRRLR